MNECKHKNREYLDGMSFSAEPPYDGTDFWWRIECKDCGITLGEGDGYSSKAEINNILNPK